jgi:endonuclease/exonuclease/phosphatase (EEP) superfamily protein YafD
MWYGAVVAPVLLLALCWVLGVFHPAEIEWFKSVAPPRLHGLISRVIR